MRLRSVCWGVLLLACSATDGPEAPDMGDASGAGPVSEGVQLVVDPLPAETSWTSIPVRGSGPADGTLIVRSTLDTVTVVDIGPSGDFCIDVGLASGQRNELELSAVSSEGEESAPTVIEVRQLEADPAAPVEPAGPAEATYKNSAFGGAVTAGPVTGSSWTALEIADGELAVATDGKSGTAIRLMADTWWYRGWVVVALPAPAQVSRIKILSDPARPLASFSLYTAAGDGAPPEHSYSSLSWGSGWTKVAERVDVGPLTDWGLGTEPGTITHVGIDFSSSDAFGGRPDVTIREIQAWSLVPPGTEPPTSMAMGPRCGG